MKPIKIFSVFLFVFFLLASSLHSQGDPHVNQLTIRSDKVFELNGVPFFPIGLCFELGENAYHDEFYKNYPYSTQKWGFNFINLFSQNAYLYYVASLNMISGDTSTSTQYRDILGAYWGNINWRDNFNRIDNYLDEEVYLLADGVAFTSNDATHWEWNGGVPPYGDNITVDPPFNQNVRNANVRRIDTLARQDKSNLIGFYSMDDANFFQAQGPEDPMYYYNNFKNSKIEDLDSTYDYARSLYNNSMVMMSIVPFFFPKAFDPTNWTDVEKTRDAWVSDAIDFSQGANVLFSPAYMSLENSNDWAGIYENGYPKWFPKHIKETLIDRVLYGATENKAVMGGIIFDVAESNPDPNDSLLERKVKWTNYVGLQKGATGLIFFGWHLRWARINIWNAIKNQVDTLANVLDLDNNVFLKGNSGPVGYSIASSLTGADVSYAVYKVNGWDEYYLLVTNNPTGDINEPAADNTVTLTSSVSNFCYYNIKEIFSNNTILPSSIHQFSYVIPWYGTALFHVKKKNPLPNNCPEEKLSKVESNIPQRFYLDQNYPNPFNPSTVIKFGLPKDEYVTIEIYNNLGQLVSVVVNENKSAGYYEIRLDGMNYSSGIYFYRIKAGNFIDTKKMLLIK
jgi:hypothetical protein